MEERNGSVMLTLALTVCAAGCGGETSSKQPPLPKWLTNFDASGIGAQFPPPSMDGGGCREAGTRTTVARSPDAGRLGVRTEAGKAETGKRDAGKSRARELDAATVDATDSSRETSWTPTRLGPTLAFWLDPTSLIEAGGSVPRWMDLSGNGNDATQPTAEYQPIYNGGGIRGLPSATFSGPITFLDIADGSSMQWGTDDFAVFAVVRGRTQSASSAMVYQKTGASPYDGAALYLNAGKPVQTVLAAAQVSGAVYVVSAAPPATFDDGTVHVLGARRAGATLEIRVDGAVSRSIDGPTVSAVDVSSNGVDAMIGQNGYAPVAEFQQVHGDIAEIVATHGVLALEDVAALERYLKLRYGIP
jgi:hypothetical protein